MEKVAYDPDFFTRVKDIFQKRKKRDLDTYDANHGEKVSFFNYIKESSAGKCKASSSQRENEVIKKRRKRNILSASRKRFSSEFAREKRRAEQELLELQHEYVRCNRNTGPKAEECMEINVRFQNLVKEVNEKFHQFSNDNFEDVAKMRRDSKQMKMEKPITPDQTNEVKPAKKVSQVPNLQKNNENVGQAYFGDGFYSYTYDQLPRFHEDLNGNFNSKQRNLKSMSREQTDPFHNQNGPETLIRKENQATNIPVKVPDNIGERYDVIKFSNLKYSCV